MSARVVFIQKRTHRAGAQTCLARLFSHSDLAPLKPILVCEQADGWLWETAGKAGIDRIAFPFPSSRSLYGKAWGNRSFGTKIANQLKRIHGEKFIIHANDHLEGLLGHSIADRLGAHRAIFLRAPGMTRNDYYKYRCNEYEMIAAVGDSFRDSIQTWDDGNRIRLIHDGIGSNEFLPPIERDKKFPNRLLIVGSPLRWKGWKDLVDAMVELEKEPAIPSLELHFTGDKPSAEDNDLGLSRLRTTKVCFLGRVEGFRNLLRNYALVINPSRQETFGMAAIETVAAGVPLLSSRSGIIDQVLDPYFLFEPHNPSDLALSIKRLYGDWETLDWESGKFQDRIRDNFLVDKAVAKLLDLYAKMLSD